MNATLTTIERNFIRFDSWPCVCVCVAYIHLCVVLWNTIITNFNLADEKYGAGVANRVVVYSRFTQTHTHTWADFYMNKRMKWKKICKQSHAYFTLTKRKMHRSLLLVHFWWIWWINKSITINTSVSDFCFIFIEISNRRLIEKINSFVFLFFLL